MEKILENILAELKKQTKEMRFTRTLMEDVFLKQDENSHKKQKVQQSINLLKSQIMQTPALQGNAEAMTMINEMFKMI